MNTKWSIGTKIGLGYAVAIAIFLVINIISYNSMTSSIESSKMVIETKKIMTNVENLATAMVNAETGERGYVITGNEAYLEPYNDAKKKINTYIDELNKRVKSDEVKQKLADMKPKIDSWLSFIKGIIDLRRTKGFEAALAEINTNKGKSEMDEIRKLMDDMNSLEENLWNVRVNKQDSELNSSKSFIVWGTALAIVFLSIIGFLITRNISTPLRKVAAVADSISQGELNITIAPGNRQDEIGILMLSFNAMLQNLQKMADIAENIAGGNLTVEFSVQSKKDILGTALLNMIKNLRKQTEELMESIAVIAGSASQISSTTTQIASSFSEIAASVAETVTSLKEVKQTAEMSSQKSRMVSESSENVMRVSKHGEASVNDTIESIKGIQEQMSSIAESIIGLSQQTQSIGEIIAVVDDISEQSRLLAVNASIEAVKAGEMGKGFAVVAGEIKNLAQESKQSTGKVRTILNDIQKATSATAMATERGNKAVEDGVKQVKQTGESIQQLGMSIMESAQGAIQISATLSQQEAGIDQVFSAMENINQAVNQNVEGAKQLEKAARSLQELGQKIKALVNRYKV